MDMKCSDYDPEVIGLNLCEVKHGVHSPSF